MLQPLFVFWSEQRKTLQVHTASCLLHRQTDHPQTECIDGSEMDGILTPPPGNMAGGPNMMGVMRTACYSYTQNTLVHTCLYQNCYHLNSLLLTI